MELKSYQKRVLKDLDSFLAQLGATNNIISAYNRHWAEQNVQVGFGVMPPYSNTLHGTPHVCFKVRREAGRRSSLARP